MKTKMHRHECNTHIKPFFYSENQIMDFSYAIFPVKEKNKCWKNFKIKENRYLFILFIHVMKLKIWCGHRRCQPRETSQVLRAITDNTPNSIVKSEFTWTIGTWEHVLQCASCITHRSPSGREAVCSPRRAR
jgi:hypothetical protein